jgi:hypothetical protein
MAWRSENEGFEVKDKQMLSGTDRAVLLPTSFFIAPCCRALSLWVKYYYYHCWRELNASLGTRLDLASSLPTRVLP